MCCYEFVRIFQEVLKNNYYLRTKKIQQLTIFHAGVTLNEV